MLSNKKLYWLIVFLNLFYSFSAISQTNLIDNSSFEDGINGKTPNNLHQVEDYLNDWKDNLDIDKDPDGIDPDRALHSPDWFLYPSFPLSEYLSGSSRTIVAHSGNGYVGMGWAELIQQKLDGGEEVVEGVEYTVSMFIRPTFFIGGYTNATLSVYLAARDIEYQNSKYTDFCKEGYDYFKGGGSRYQVAKFNISLSQYPVGQWYKVSGNFIAPTPAHNWFVIELVDYITNKDYCDSYLLIDDVVLGKACEVSCSGTAGQINVTINQSHKDDVPFCVFGLDNVSNFDLKIYQNPTPPVCDGSEIRHIQIPNPNNTVCWDGKNSAGIEVASASYGYKLVLTNDCGTKTFNGCFTKVTDIVTNPSPYFNYTSVTKPPKACCLSDLVIQNQTITGTPDFIASNSITAGPAVTIQAGSDVLFQAGNIIDILPGGLEVEGGAKFEMLLAPCTYSGKKGADNFFEIENVDTPKNGNIKKEDLKHVSENIFEIIPNPFLGNTHFEYSLQSQSTLTLTIHNVFGQEVSRLIDNQVQESGIHTLTFDASTLPTGIYFCTFSARSEKGEVFREVKKLVKLK